MKKQLNMRTIFVIVITALLAKPVVAQATKRAFEKRIMISAPEVRIDTLLKIFSRQTGAGFSFNSKKISPSKKLLVPKQINTLGQWLTILRESVGADYKVVGNHIILVDNSKQNTTGPKSYSSKTVAQKVPIKKTGILSAVQKAKASEADKTAKGEKRLEAFITQNSSSSIDTIATSSTNLVMSDTLAAFEKVSATMQQKPLENPKKVIAVPDAKLQSSLKEIKVRRQEGERDEFEGQAIQIVLGKNKHGSGDLGGIIFGAEYLKYYSKRFSLNYNFRAAINSGIDALYSPVPLGGGYNDVSVRETTAGVQLGINAGLSFIRTKSHDVKISFGPFFRYQSESNSDGYAVYGPQATGIPTILVGYNHRSPQITYSVGALLQLQYDYTFNNKIYVGITPGFQTDTHGNAIPQVGLVIGRRL